MLALTKLIHGREGLNSVAASLRKQQAFLNPDANRDAFDIDGNRCISIFQYGQLAKHILAVFGLGTGSAAGCCQETLCVAALRARSGSSNSGRPPECRQLLHAIQVFIFHNGSPLTIRVWPDGAITNQDEPAHDLIASILC